MHRLPAEYDTAFRKSTFSKGDDDECVEVADLDFGHAVRDTTQRELGALLFGSESWGAFLEGVKTGELGQ